MNRFIYLYTYAIKNYANFSGRACRMEAISFYIVYITLFIIDLYLLFSAIWAPLTTTGATEVNRTKLILAAVYFIALIFHVIPAYALGARRLHDLNISGWWQAIAFVPYIGGMSNFVFFILFCFVPGTPGENLYGPESENY